MTWLILCLISLAFQVTYGLISKKMLTNGEDHHPLAFASALHLTVALLAFVTYLFTGFHTQDAQHLFLPSIFPLLLFNMICYSVGSSLYYRALKNLPISEMTVIYSLTGIFALLIGVLIGTETFHFSRLIGGAIIISAVMLLMLKNSSWRTSKYIWMLAGATIVYALASISDNRIIESQQLSLLFFQSVSFGLPSLFMLALNPSSIPHLSKIYNRKVYPIVFVGGIFYFLSFFAIYNAYKYGGAVSQVLLVMSTDTVITVVFAALFLKERKNLALKILAAGLAVLGVYLLK